MAVPRSTRWFLGTLWLVSAIQAETASRQSYLVGYHEASARPLGLFATHRGLDRVSAMGMDLTDDEVVGLQADPNVDYIELDTYEYPNYETNRRLAEVIPYGIDMIQANVPLPQTASTTATSSGSCDDPNVFKIGIVDSGVDRAHPDGPCWTFSGTTNCIGQSFGLDGAWYNPSDPHGTHVTGIIGAKRNNGIGVEGILEDGTSVCYIIARVFGDTVDAARISDILDGVEYVVEQGAAVINLSLGGGLYSSTADRYYQSLAKQGILVFAAAGNDGSSDYSYPASYSSVVSVGAVDANRKVADFSQHNDKVALAAPGVGVLSTVPDGMGGITSISGSGGWAVTGSLLGNSPIPGDSGVGGVLIDCGLGYTCDSATTGHVCLIERGDIYFEDKALACQDSGGVAALIYNNEAGDLAGTLSTPTAVDIPVAGLLQTDGQALVDRVGTVVDLTVVDGYGIMDGTSFSSPHAAGAAAGLWQRCRQCQAGDIVQCLESTAVDLGTANKDDFYGFGLIQMYDAFTCLVDDIQCCTAGDVVTSPPTPAPVVADASNPDSATCVAAQAAYQQCFADQMASDASEACRQCVNNEIPGGIQWAPCSLLQTSICPAILVDCDCSPCRTPIEDYLSCVVDDVTGGDCDLQCQTDTGLSDEPPDTASPSACDLSRTQMRTCFSSQIMAAAVSTDIDQCETCVMNAIPNGTDALGCLGLETTVCLGVGQCGCQQCRDEMTSYAACLTSVVDSTCEIDCAASNATSTPVESESLDSNATLTSAASTATLALAAVISLLAAVVAAW